MLGCAAKHFYIVSMQQKLRNTSVECKNLAHFKLKVMKEVECKYVDELEVEHQSICASKSCA